ncbi:MAG: hypothetical protein HN517_05370 [Candidatus Marinimicrobia bacterium]|nr:hypothetical protein [Candidatus Neomarinimicrobiota bacterium]
MPFDNSVNWYILRREKWVARPTFRLYRDMIIREKVENLLPKGIHLLDMKEDSRGRSVRLVIDSDQAIDLRMTTDITRRVNNAGVLDSAFPSGYSLEVSTPGVSTPLTKPYQFSKNVGRILKLVLNRGETHQKVQAELLHADDDGIQFVKTDSEPERIFYRDIIEAKVNISID